MASSSLQISKISKRYESVVALAPTDLDVGEGEFLTLLGPSGSGKTTLLGVIAGLMSPDGGSVRIGGMDVTYSPPYERDIGMVFQNYALFPHMTIEQNVAFPLRMRKTASAEIRRRVGEALEMVRLPHVAKRYPRELSGGQQQRVALARCMVHRPSIIMMDEPLGALDKKLREQMQLEIKRIHRELRTTIVYVTHDQEEAMTMSDRICLMNGGAIEQLGTPDDLYFRPRSVFVADFLGESNLLPATVKSVDGGYVDVAIGDAVSRATGNGAHFSAGQSVKVMIRPQNVAVSANGSGVLTGRLSEIMVTGSLTKLYVESPISGMPLLAAAYPTRNGGTQHTCGELVSLSWQPSDAVVIADTAAA